MSDPIADMFNRIKNAQMVLQKTTDVPFSRLNYHIAEILKREGFILDVKKRGKKPHQMLRISLKYNENKQPALSAFKRISKPSRRVYKGAKKIFPVKNGYGIAIISTTAGLLTDKQARKNKLGGEVIVEVW
jgi:small subunit ribosomal protein S8